MSHESPPSSLDGAPSSRRRRLLPEERRAQLLSIAMQAFGEHGIGRANHGDIARRAGVSTATVFNYFSTREALVDVVLETCEHRFKTMFDAVASDPIFQASSPRDRLLFIARACEQMIETYPDTAKVYLNWSASFDAGTRPRYQAFSDAVMARVRQLAPKGIRSDNDARILFGATNMITQMKLDGVERDLMESFVLRLTNIIVADS